MGRGFESLRRYRYKGDPGVFSDPLVLLWVSTQALNGARSRPLNSLVLSCVRLYLILVDFGWSFPFIRGHYRPFGVIFVVTFGMEATSLALSDATAIFGRKEV